MNRCLTRIALAAGLSLTATVGLAGPAGADTTVMGSTLANDFQSPGFSIAAPTVSAQISFDPTTSPNPVVSPANGVITGWKVKSADDGALYTLKVLRPNGPVTLVAMKNSSFTAIASVKAPSAVPAGTFTTTPTGVIFKYPASIPISKGDYVGLRASGAVTDLPQNTTNGLSRNLIANNFTGKPADGASANLLADKQHDLLLQATIEFCNVPSVVGQSEAAAAAAIAAGDCTSSTSAQTLLLKRIKKTFSKKKKRRIRAANTALQAENGLVLSQSVPPGTTSAPGGAVALTVAEVVKPPKKKRKKH